MLLLCGDTFLRTRDGSDPFVHMLERFQGSVVCVNLETALAGPRRKRKNVALAVPVGSLDCLPDTVQLVSVVNNHVADCGRPSTLVSALQERGKTVVGPQNPARASAVVGGIPVDFFSAYFSLPRLRASYKGAVAASLERAIRASDAKQRVVNLHWGWEHTSVPAPFQRDLARRLVDAGANIIVGHHPHVPQGWELIDRVPVFYSLGNFNFWQFDREATEENKWGYMVAFDPVSGAAEPIPYAINSNYQPILGQDAFQEGQYRKRLAQLCCTIQDTSLSQWFDLHYRGWYTQELTAWRRLCCNSASIRLWLKWLVWMILPVQLLFYLHATFLSERECA